MDWLIFALGCTGNSILIEYGGPPANETTEACAASLEMEMLTDIEIMESIEFKNNNFPEKPGVYKWEGTFTWWESKDWETGYVDDWHLVADGGAFSEITAQLVTA